MHDILPRQRYISAMPSLIAQTTTKTTTGRTIPAGLGMRVTD